MSIISSLGGGSGLDTTRLIEDLANASRTPKVELFARRVSTVQAKISAVAQARSDLESFANSLAELVAGGTLQSQPSTSDPSIFSATASAGARAGALASELIVDQLAKAQTIYSGYVSDATAPIGQGTLTLTVGSQTHSINVVADNDSLAGLASAINAAASGVTASILTDASGSRIVLRGQLGNATAFTLETQDTALQRFSYGNSVGMTLGQSAQDAKFTVDGVAYARDRNTITDVFPGVTLSLKKAAPGVPVTLSSSRPNDALRQTLQDFVAVFNTLKQDLAAARSVTGGDGALRTLERQLSDLLTSQLTSNPNIRNLTDVGIGTNRDGSVSLNATKLEAALRSFPDEVEALFSPTRDSTHTDATDPGIGRVLKSLNDKATKGDGILESLRKRLEKEAAGIAKDKERMEVREAAYRSRLERQFGTLDSRISTLKATQSYLEQQVRVWTNEN